MRPLSKSTAITITLGYRKSNERLAQQVRGELEQRITRAIQAEDLFDDLADMGRRIREYAREAVRSYRKPEGIVVRDVVITFFSEEDGRGKMVMKIGCRRDGRMEIF